ANHVPDLFARNERLVCIFDGPAGSYAIILVGAMIVAGIETVWSGQVAPPNKLPSAIDYGTAIELPRGAEMGRFKLGSTVILLFGGKTMHWHKHISAGQSVRVGETIGALQGS
ncbi:MAG: phosphatidylserine decarboxylase, partial [Pseudomonadales bacterium]|nr:phosphatidylserine decarboxylase [Pseudomonadales bacterium]